MLTIVCYNKIYVSAIYKYLEVKKRERSSNHCFRSRKLRIRKIRDALSREESSICLKN